MNENEQTTSTFDPDTFMNQTVDQPFSTEAELCPEGEFPALVDSFDGKAFRQIEWKDKESGADRSSPMLSLPWVIQDENVKATLERTKVVVPQDMFIDMRDGHLDWAKGKNTDLGRIRTALRQNEPGPWTFAMLQGAGPAMVRVKHIPDKANPERKRAKVVAVTRIV